jgi:hypothetical protein
LVALITIHVEGADGVAMSMTGVRLLVETGNIIHGPEASLHLTIDVVEGDLVLTPMYGRLMLLEPSMWYDEVFSCE